MKNNPIQCSMTVLAISILSSFSYANEAIDKPEEVVITASRSTEKVREISSNVTIITQEDIKKSSANSMDQLMIQNGFQVINYGSQKVLNIRGMGQVSMGDELQSRVLVLINGRRIGSNNSALIGMNKNNIERIEIIRGPSAVQYGSSAMGGVVNIITKKGQDGFQVSAELGAGSFNLHKEVLSVSGSKNNFDFAAGISRFGRDDYKVSGDKKWRHTDIGSSTTTNIDLGYTFLENHRVGVSFNNQIQNDVNSPKNGWSATGAINDDRYYNHYNQLSNHNLGFTYDGATSDKTFDWMLRYSFGKDTQKLDSSHTSAKGGIRTKSTLDNKAFTAQTSYNGSITTLTVGLDYLKYKQNSTDNDTSTSQDVAGYFNGKLRLLDEKLIFSAGGRYDRFEMKQSGKLGKTTKETNFAPTIGVAAHPLNWMKLRANYSEGFRIGAPKEFFGKAPWYVANTNLKPEKSKTYEIGTDINYRFLSSSLTYFHTDWKDKIKADNVPGQSSLYQYHNLSSSTIEGLEFSISADIDQAANWEVGVRPYANLTWYTKRKNGDPEEVKKVGSDVLTNTPEYTVAYGVDFNYPKYDLSANLNATYFSRILTKDSRIGSPTKNKYIKTGRSTTANFTLDKGLYRSAYGELSLRFEANNLFDSKNEPYIDYPGPGRNFYLGLKYNY